MRIEINTWNELRLYKLPSRVVHHFQDSLKDWAFQSQPFLNRPSCYASRQLYFSNMQVSNLFINLALSVLEGKTENMVRRLDYSPSLLGKHKRTSVLVELSDQNIKWFFIINTTTFLLQCITKARITTCLLQLSVHRNDNYCL